MDSCFSGTAVRGEAEDGLPDDMEKYPQLAVTGIRRIPDDDRAPPPASSFAVGERGVDGISGTGFKYALISAAREQQVAFEHPHEQGRNGALTYFLCRALRSTQSTERLTYRALMDAVGSAVNAHHPNQNPQLEGTALDQVVFGDTTALSNPYFLANPYAPGKIKIDGGLVHGLTSGSRFDVYAPGTRVFAAPAKPIARASLAEVTPFDSSANIGNKQQIPQGSRAVERAHKYSHRMSVYLSGPEGSPQMPEIRKALTDLRHVQVVNDATRCQMQVRWQSGKILTLTPDGYTLSPPVTAASSGAAQDIVRQVNGWAKWFNVLRINNGNNGPPVKFEIAGQGSILARFRGVDLVLSDGEPVTLTIQNISQQDLYVSVADLSTDGSIAPVYPRNAGAAELVQKGGTITFRLRARVPEKRTFVKDTLKVFASSKPVDITPLLQPGIRSEVRAPDEPSALSELLAASEGGTRGFDADDLSEWTTVQRTVFIRKRR
jgi:hypothetical protein